MDTAKLCIVLPMFNEELSLPGLKQMFAQGLNLPGGWDYYLLVVNDGSTDHTLQLVRQWEHDLAGQMLIFNHEHNLGLGEAILTGFRQAINLGCDCILTMDADASHPVETINKMVEAIIHGADIAIASRFVPGAYQYGVSWDRRIYSLGARCLLSWCFPLKGVRDYTVSFRIYRSSLIKEALQLSAEKLLTLQSFACAAELLLKIATIAEKIQEVPLILHYENKKSASKLRVGKTIKDYFKLVYLPRRKCSLGRGLLIT